MSTILDALKKAEESRAGMERPEGGIHPPAGGSGSRRRGLAIAIGTALFLAGVGSALFFVTGPGGVREKRGPAGGENVSAAAVVSPRPESAFPAIAAATPSPTVVPAVSPSATVVLPTGKKTRPPAAAVPTEAPPPAPSATPTNTPTVVPAPTPPPAGSSFPRLHLSGILWDEKEPLAVINDEWVKEGDEIEGAKVLTIEFGGVTVDFHGRRRRLRVK